MPRRLLPPRNKPPEVQESAWCVEEALSSYLRGGRDLDADSQNKINDKEAQDSAFTTAGSSETGTGEQGATSDCSNVANAILPSLSALDEVSASLLAVLRAWGEHRDLPRLRRSILGLLTALS